MVEAWGFLDAKCQNIGNIHPKFHKQLLEVRYQTENNYVHREIDYVPLQVN